VVVLLVMVVVQVIDAQRGAATAAAHVKALILTAEQHQLSQKVALLVGD